MADLEKDIRTEFNRMRGRICGMIEACGLEERHEEGIKATFKSLSYDTENKLVDLTKP